MSFIEKMQQFKISDLLPECSTSSEENKELDMAKNMVANILNEEQNISTKNDNSLKKQTKLLHQWITKIERSIEQLDEEIIYLNKKKNSLQKAKAVLKIAVNINLECNMIRSTKLDSTINDLVDCELKKEKLLIEEVNSKLENGLASVEEILQEIKTVKLNLELIWSKKIENYNIECDNISLNHYSGNLMLKYGATRSTNNCVQLSDWENNIENSLNITNDTLLISHNKHSELDNKILIENQRGLRLQAEKVDLSLMKESSATENDIQRLKIELNSIIDKQNDTEKAVEVLENAEKRLDKSLKLVQTRLNNRLQKPLKEHFNDETQDGFLRENENIQQQKNVIKSKKYEMDENLRKLISIKTSIERELQLKLNHLWIDGDQCPKIRIHYPSATSLSGY